jgi:hypothetical protein
MLVSGKTDRDGLFWVLFWAVAKKYLARGARTAMPNKMSPVNTNQQVAKKTKITETKKPRKNEAFSNSAQQGLTIAKACAIKW